MADELTALRELVARCEMAADYIIAVATIEELSTHCVASFVEDDATVILSHAETIKRAVAQHRVLFAKGVAE